jgi:hypothetical protein
MKGGLHVGLTTLPLSIADFLGIWELQPPGALSACPDLYRDCFITKHHAMKACRGMEVQFLLIPYFGTI